MVNHGNADFIYDLMTGVYNRRIIKDSLKDIVPEDKLFESAMGEIYEARIRICDKMGLELDENTDLNIITDNYSALCRYLCRKMFLYGTNLQKI